MLTQRVSDKVGELLMEIELCTGTDAERDFVDMIRADHEHLGYKIEMLDLLREDKNQ